MQSATLDVGAINALALVIEYDTIAVYHARPEFERFQSQSDRIATRQSRLPKDQWTSHRIRRIYDNESRKRDHSNVAVEQAVECLIEPKVDTVYIGDVGLTTTGVGAYDMKRQCPECNSKPLARASDSFRCENCRSDTHGDVTGTSKCVAV